MKKKGLILALALVMGTFAVNASAQGYGVGGGAGMGGGMGYNKGWHGMGHNWNGCWNVNGNYAAPQMSIQSDADAVKAVNAYLASANLKGYKVGKATAYNTPRGVQMYVVAATDAGGNAFNFAVSPYGFVRGPMNYNNNFVPVQ